MSSCPAAALRPERGRPDALQYGSILVPILGTPLDDDIVQTAGRLAAEEDEDAFDAHRGATIEALWVFEVPMSLPIDAALPEEQLKPRARRAGARQGGGGGVRGRRGRHGDRPRAARGRRRSSRRRAGAACRRSCWPPRSRRGSAAGALLGGRGGPRENFVGEVDQARRGQGALPGDPHRPARVRDAGDGAHGRRGRRCHAGRARPLVSARDELHPDRRAPAASARPSRARCWPPATRSRCSTRTRCPTSAWTPASRRPGRTPAGASRSARRSRSTRCARPGIEEADVFIASTDGDNTNLTIAQIASRAVRGAQGDLPRHGPGARRVVRRAGAPHDLPDAATRSRCSSRRWARSG